MILQAGFDLGTFSILFNGTYSQSVLDATGINTAAAAGRYSQPAHLRHFDGLKTEPEKLCFLEIAAAIWHEKRHSPIHCSQTMARCEHAIIFT
jgi:hypothetical protein